MSAARRAGRRTTPDKEKVVMRSDLSGRIHAQLDQILTSNDGEWNEVLRVTVDALHKQFIVERSAEHATLKEYTPTKLQRSQPRPKSKNEAASGALRIGVLEAEDRRSKGRG